MSMESPYQGAAPVSHSVESRPSLCFPLGTALLLLVIFSLSGIFSCCYHWDRLRRFFSLHESDLEAHAGRGPSKPKPHHMDLKQLENQSMPVMMPGDSVPRFIALPCPCEPPRQGEIIVQVQQPPPKPPPTTVPFY